MGLAVSGRAAGTPTARKRAVTRAIKEVSHYLGNTPAVCRASYIDPRVFDRFEDGVTIGGALERLGDESRLASPRRKARSKRPFSTCWRKKTLPRSKTSPSARELAAGS